jgi:hypothetical protein
MPKRNSCMQIWRVRVKCLPTRRQLSLSSWNEKKNKIFVTAQQLAYYYNARTSEHSRRY